MPALPAKIEVKYAVVPEKAGRAFTALGLENVTPKETRTVHFFDTPDTDLFKVDLILRTRQTLTGGDPHDTTLKVRGDSAPAAADRFLDPADPGRKYEGDQNIGAAEKFSFSLTHPYAPADIAAVLAGKTPLAGIFTPEAGTLLSEAGMNLADLGAFGPIHARVWKIELPDFKGKVTVELWKAGDKELLEVSDKVDRDKAADFADRLAGFLAEKGLPQIPESKTLFALRQLQPPTPLHQ